MVEVRTNEAVINSFRKISKGLRKIFVVSNSEKIFLSVGTDVYIIKNHLKY